MFDDLAKTETALREVENRHADIMKLEQSLTVSVKAGHRTLERRRYNDSS